MNENKVIETLAQSKVAVIVPLYGYWEDAPTKQLTNAVLKIVLQRITSKKHHLYILFVGEPSRMSKDLQSTLIGKEMAGNVKGIPTPPNSTYAEYITEGIEYALANTDATYFITFNPWVMIQEGAIDNILEFQNKGTMGITSGYDVSREIPAEQFDSYNPLTPADFYDINFDFMATTRQFIEMLELDKTYQTHYFLPVDFVRRMFQKGFEVRTTQRVPIFPANIDWTQLETKEQYEADKAHFIGKWGFSPSVDYGK